MPDVPSSALPGLERVPGKQNWIENLPAPMRAAWHRSIIYRSAKHIAAKGRPVGMAIAFAKNWAQHICDTGDVKQFPGLQQVKPTSRAEACAAVALWESMRAAAKADTSIPASERQAIELAFAEVDRLGRVIELAAPFTSQLHPRAGKGTPAGGQFVRANSSGRLARAVRKKLPGKNSQNFEKAVRRYQRKNGLQVDGVVGKQTAAALLGHQNASMVNVGRITSHQTHRLLSVLGQKRSNRPRSSTPRSSLPRVNRHRRPQGQRNTLTRHKIRQARQRASTLSRVRDYLTGVGLLDLAEPKPGQRYRHGWVPIVGHEFEHPTGSSGVKIVAVHNDGRMVTYRKMNRGKLLKTQATVPTSVFRQRQQKLWPKPRGVNLATPSGSAMREAVKQGHAMPAPGQDRPGRFNIRNRSELSDAIRAVGRAKPATDAERAKVRRFILKRARELGATNLIPDNWASDGSLK